MPYDDFGGAFGGLMAAGEETGRRRRQNAAMDDLLRQKGIGPERQMRIDPVTAGQSLEAIMRNPAPAPVAPKAPPAGIPDRPSYAAQSIAAAPPMQFGAGSFAPVFTPSDPVIGAGINIRDDAETQLAKMGMKSQREVAAWEAMNNAQRNQAIGRQTDVSLFDAQSRAASDRDRMAQAERFQADESRRHAEGLRSADALAALTRQHEMDKLRWQVGPEWMKGARQAALYKLFTENPAEAQKGLEALLRFESGAPMPGAPAPAAKTDSGLLSPDNLRAFSKTASGAPVGLGLGLANQAKQALFSPDSAPAASAVPSVGIGVAAIDKLLRATGVR